MIMNLINTCIRETSSVSDSLRVNDLNFKKIGILQKVVEYSRNNDSPKINV